ncbi:MAG TPA: response regulator [Verrucomicrobiae bacterium]|jgi:HD-like signal output (HDOD) protein|nr:response regulator [Verrucomicrobiae bacterium]
MAEKRILIADADSKAWDVFRQALGDSWIVVGAASGNAALAEAQKQPFDVVVANYQLPELDGAELLNRLRVSNPKALRFIAAAENLKDQVVCHVVGGHQFLAVPFDKETLKVSIERSMTVDYGMSSSMRELVGRIRTFPTIPSLYLEIVNALKDPNACTEDVGAIIAKDMAMTTKLVQVLNSAYFGLPRTITDPTEAVGILGFETVKSLTMTVKLLSQYDKVKPVYFSIDSIWRHSTNVARTARVMALLETGDNECSATAYTAGLMHDLGKVILAANFDEQYQGAHAVARKRQIPLWDVEKDIFGATHGEIGAYLLSLWGMSAEVVRVAAMHHSPANAGDKGFTPLTAVHVANALEYEGIADNDDLPVAVLDAAYLRQLKLEDRVTLWRDAKSDPGAAKFENLMSRAKSGAKTGAKPVTSTPTPAAAKSAAKPGSKSAPAPSRPQRSAIPPLWKWVGIGVGVAAALAVLARLEVMRLQNAEDKPDTELAAEPVKQDVAAVTTPAKTPDATKSAPTNQVAPAVSTNLALSSTNHSTNAVAILKPTTPVPPPVAKTGFDKLKLQAIFFSSQHPSALISGKLVGVNEEVAECRVLDISPSSVTLEYQHQPKTLTLR